MVQDNPMVPEKTKVTPKKARIDYYGNAEKIYNFFRNKGESHQFAIAMLTMADGESSLNPNAIGDKGKAFGLFQHHNLRRGQIKNGYKDAKGNKIPGTGIDLSELPEVDKQLEAVWWELNNTENGAYKKIKAAKTIWSAAIDATRYFERPGHPGADVKRAHMASKWDEYFTKLNSGQDVASLQNPDNNKVWTPKEK